MRTAFLAKLSFSSLVLSIAFSVSGCKKPPYPECKKDKHCNQDLGEKCTDGKCQNCTTDDDCAGKGPAGANWTCFDFRCMDPSEVPADGAPGALGSPCTQTIDCSGGLVCTAGKCSACTDDLQCSGGTCDIATGTCSTQGGGAGQCTTDEECSMDEICDGGACVFSGVTAGDNPCGIDAIYFGFDSPQISDDAKGQLDQLAPCLVQQNRLIYLEAHADPRGTEEYNIMLTDRRGQTVKQYLSTKGVTSDNMQVISKGNLESMGTNESEWAKDRRVQFIFP